MIISGLSSALLEGFGIGKRALYYNYTGTNDYHKDFDSLIVSSISDENLFNNELDQIRNLRAEYENVKHQVNHVETFRNELAKSRKEIEDLKKEHELKIKVLNEKIDYLQLTPAKRKKYDEVKAQDKSQDKAKIGRAHV